MKTFKNEICNLQLVLGVFVTSYILRVVLSFAAFPRIFREDSTHSNFYKALYLIITSYVYNIIPILFLQVHHHNNFKPVKGRPESRQISSSSYDAITVSDQRGTQIESPRD